MYQLNMKNQLSKEIQQVLAQYEAKEGKPPSILEVSDELTGIKDVELHGVVVKTRKLVKSIVLVGE